MTVTLAEPEAIPSDWDELVALGKRCLKARAIADLTFARVCRKMLDGPGSRMPQDVADALGCSTRLVQQAVKSLKIAKTQGLRNGDLERTYDEAKRRIQASPRRQPSPPPEPQEESYHMLDRDAAAALTTEIRETVDIALLIDAEKGRADAALDYSSWDRYIHAELGDVEFYATRDERQEAVHTLAEGGMSNRQIGHALHMDEKTVRGDLKALGTPEPPTVCEPVTITPSVMTSPLHYARQAQALVEEIDREGYGTDDLTPAQRDALDRLRAVLAQFSQVWEMEENDQIREGRK